MAAPTKHDWVKISKEYIEAPSDDLRPSLVALASKYNVSIKYIEQKCSKEKWVEQSKIFLRRVSQESKQEKVSSLAGEQTKFDADILTVARALQGQIIGHLNEAKIKKELLPPKDIKMLATIWRMEVVRNLLIVGGVLRLMSLMELFKVTPSGIWCQLLSRKLIVIIHMKHLINLPTVSGKVSWSWLPPAADSVSLNFLERLYGTSSAKPMTTSDLCFLKKVYEKQRGL